MKVYIGSYEAGDPEAQKICDVCGKVLGHNVLMSLTFPDANDTTKTKIVHGKCYAAAVKGDRFVKVN